MFTMHANCRLVSRYAILDLVTLNHSIFTDLFLGTASSQKRDTRCTNKPSLSTTRDLSKLTYIHRLNIKFLRYLEFTRTTNVSFSRSHFPILYSGSNEVTAAISGMLCDLTALVGASLHTNTNCFRFRNRLPSISL